MEQEHLMPLTRPAQSRRGRPSAARVSAIEQAIVETARTLFLLEGYDAVAMEQVAAAADISKGTLYARYPSKEALFTAVIEGSVRDWAQEASHGDHLLTDDIGQRLHHHARTIAAALQRPDVLGLQRLILSMRGRFPALAAAMHQSGYGYIVGLISNDIERASRRDGRPVNNPRSVAEMLVAGISGFQIEQEADPEKGQDLAEFAQHLVEVVISGRAAW